MHCKGTTSGVIFTPHTPSTARTFNQASSPGGEAAMLAQIPAQGNYSAKGCFGLVHQTPTLPRWHSLLTADKGRDQHFAFMGCNGCVDCFWANAHCCDAWSSQHMVGIDIRFLLPPYPTKKENFSSATAEYFLDGLELCGFLAWTQIWRNRNTKSMVGLIFHRE